MGRLFKSILKPITAIALLSISLWVSAEPSVKITMLLSGESQLYYDAVDGVQEQLNEVIGLDYSLTTTSDLNESSINNLNNNSDYIIAVGTKALRAISLSNTSAPVLNILVSRRSYQSIRKGVKEKSNFSIIYLDQPPQRLAVLAKLILNDRASKVAMLFGPTSASERIDYITAMSDLSLQLNSRVEKSGKGSLNIIESLVKESDVYIALFDRDVLNRKIAKWLLYMANVYHKPVIAYSKAYVEAGAVAAIYTTPIDAGRSAASWLLENIRSDEAVKWNSYPQRFTVDINRRIASKLNLTIDATDVVSARIKAAEVKQ